MKNPLNRRLPREIKSDLGKYMVLFIFITGMIAIVSGFLVASGSMITAYDESFEKYNIEDGNFETVFKADDRLIETLEQAGVTIYENVYIEKETDEIDSTIRIFKNREEINRVCIMEGSLPEHDNEIAIDRMYADNNKVTVGDTILIDGKALKVTGLVAFSDYSALFSSTSDMMFDAVKFCVAVMTEEGFSGFGEGGIHYSYSWIYDNAPADDVQEKEMSKELLEVLLKNTVITEFIPQFANQAIQFTGNDMGRDEIIFTMFLYVVVVIIAFIFAITTTNTIAKEASVIGTLRATGYTKSELIRHYIAMPVIVTLLSAVAGNVLGYTWFKDVAADMYYASYSLTTYVVRWNADAFIKTTVVPVILMIAINFVILAKKLELSPLRFLRHDLSKRKKKKAWQLNKKIAIIRRFRLRIIFQNMPNYITIVVGIFLANLILLFGAAMPAMLENYEEEITSNLICNYQYILKAPVETENKDAEKYCISVLNTIEGRLKSEDVSVFGIIPDSKYVELEPKEDEVYISNTLSEKFGIEAGDKVTLKEEYGEGEYSFKVKGVYYYPAGIAVFMNREYFNETFGNDEEYFNGYFSDVESEDIDEMYIAAKITVDDMTKTSRQLTVSMGSMMDMFFGFGIIMFMLIIYLLSKIVIEKNAQSISMTKILGYTNREINGLYVKTTSLVVITSLIFTIPVAAMVLEYLFVIIFSEYPGWITYYVPFMVYVKIAVAGIVSYAVIAFLQFGKVKRIPLDMALKNVE